MVTKLHSSACSGIQSIPVQIEIDIQKKVKNLDIVGLPGLEVRESSKRIEIAMENSGFHFPGKKIVVNLAPAGLKKAGTLFDLPIALGIIHHETHLTDLEKFLIVGELSLDGSLQAITGGLPIAYHAKHQGFHKIICPQKNASEMAFIPDVEVYAFSHLKEVVAFLQGKFELQPAVYQATTPKKTVNKRDMQDIYGQEAAKRGIEIAAAGAHNLLMIGPPGTGKTMLAKRIPGIIPPMNRDESLETTMIYSVSGKIETHNPILIQRPFRAPHHTASHAAIVGGGKYPGPGEVSLAHNGVLFLDEIQLFPSNVLQVLRQPMEDGQITISRAGGTITLPSRFMLIAALNPSRGNADYNQWEFDTLKPILNRLSGPFLDRIDLHLQVSRIRHEDLKDKKKGRSTAEMRESILKARNIQRNRLKQFGLHTNSEMNHSLIEKFCILSPKAEQLLKLAMDQLMMSIRTYDKILKISRTIADLEANESIDESHIGEALQYRILDRFMARFE